MLKIRRINESKNAFTLAEVLITLGVIGVVAALTIPILSQNADEKATVTALKKAYSTLSQAYKLAEQDNGSPDTWGIVASSPPNGDAPMLNNIKPYLNLAKDCTSGSKGCFPTGVDYLYLGPPFGSFGIFDNQTYPKIRLSNGTSIFAVASSASCSSPGGGTTDALQNVCGTYRVDINGNKGPNQLGRDLFVFYLTRDGIIPYGSQPEAVFPFSSSCRDKSNQTGLGCTAWVLFNENLDYLHCNTLGWGIKSTCN